MRTSLKPRSTPRRKPKPPKMPAEIINLFGGPCTGKSTVAAGVFFELKKRRVQCELVPEVAKGFTWENRRQALSNQIYIAGKQIQHVERCADYVDVIVMDTSILLGAIYQPAHYPSSFTDTLVDLYNLMYNASFYLERSFPYDPVGRNQTEQEATDIDPKVLRWLRSRHIAFQSLRGRHPDSASDEMVHQIVGDVLRRIDVVHQKKAEQIEREVLSDPASYVP